MKADIFFFDIVNGWSRRWVWLDKVGIFIAVVIPFFFVIPIILFPTLLLKTILTVIIARLMVEVGRDIHFRPRPHLSRSIIPQPNRFSFPSSHALVFFSLATLFLSFSLFWGLIYLSLAILIGLSRIFVGVHWPSDIAVGAIIGSLIGLIIGFW